jgi:hypothetical protein
MREYPDTIPEAYRADPALTEAYEDGWLMAARLEDEACEWLGHNAWCHGIVPDKEYHYDVWFERVQEHQRRGYRFNNVEEMVAFYDGAHAAIVAGLAAYTDADYLAYRAEEDVSDQPDAGRR